MHLFPLTFWVTFHGFLVAAICGDLWATKHLKKSTVPWILSGMWITSALSFGGVLFVTHGTETAQTFINGYLIEKSLSIDNVFVFYLVFHKLAVPPAYQHRILFLGVVGALLFRALFIVAGVALVKKFMWLIPLMGIFLIYMAITFWKNEESHETGRMLALIKSWFRIHPTIKGPHFTVKENRKRYLTVSGFALIYIEFSDMIFAFDSVPAIMAFTLEPELIYLCNVFAILGLRSLYFVIAEMSQRFKSVHASVSLLLAIAGIKMLISPFYHLPTFATMVLIFGVVVGCITLEIRNLRKQT